MYSFARWPVRYSNEKRQRRVSGKQCLLYSQVQEKGDTAHHPGPQGKTPGKSGGRRQEGETPRPWPILGFPQERQRRAGDSLGLAGLNHCNRLWVLGVDSSIDSAWYKKGREIVLPRVQGPDRI